ncbi:MAG: NAD-dependent epimerase/dehydratase family protein [Kouleothrix sp.]
MNVLVTGGAGYIGSAVVEELLADQHTPVVYDNLVAGHREAVPPDVAFVQGDLFDGALLRQTLERHAIDAVVHLAAFLQPNESINNPGKYFENNVAGTVALLNGMATQGVRRFILSSSCATFGNPVYTPIGERHPQQPISPYGLSKLMIEQMLPWYEQPMAYAIATCATSTPPARRPGAARITVEIHLLPLVLQVAMGEARARHDLWRRLRHPRRHLCARLHSYQRPGARACAGAGAAGVAQL